MILSTCRTSHSFCPPPLLGFFFLNISLHLVPWFYIFFWKCFILLSTVGLILLLSQQSLLLDWTELSSLKAVFSVSHVFRLRKGRNLPSIHSKLLLGKNGIVMLNYTHMWLFNIPGGWSYSAFDVRSAQYCVFCIVTCLLSLWLSIPLWFGPKDSVMLAGDWAVLLASSESFRIWNITMREEWEGISVNTQNIWTHETGAQAVRLIHLKLSCSLRVVLIMISGACRCWSLGKNKLLDFIGN